MATAQSTIDHLLDQLTMLDDVTARKMFGEYALYHSGKVVALICDDQLFIKPSPAEVTFKSRCQEASPYPGAKNYWLVPEELWQEREWLAEVVKQTADALPEPKKKK
jgi:TfoX/Sxy family transcriptional regulator of competence genes